MIYRYYYTPLFSGNAPGMTNPDTGEVFPGSYTKEPGVDLGAGVVLSGGLPPGLTVLHYDDALSRCVVKLHGGTAPPISWVEKSSSDILVAYPNLQGVV